LVLPYRIQSDDETCRCIDLVADIGKIGGNCGNNRKNAWNILGSDVEPQRIYSFHFPSFSIIF
jgi:hypothetical protein